MNPETLADITFLLVYMTGVCGALIIAGALTAVLEKILRLRK